LAPRQLDAVFLGGKQAGCVGLLASIAAGCDVRGVVGYDELVRELASALELRQFDSIGDDGTRGLLRESDLLISVHGRELVPDDLLRLPRLGGINVHPCLYAYKGANPVGRLLADGNPKASVGVHRMTSELDGGEVLVEEFVDVSEASSVDAVYNRLYPHYATALVRALTKLTAV
jgi:methionyl-tRNA formyltransferase